MSRHYPPSSHHYFPDRPRFVSDWPRNSGHCDRPRSECPNHAREYRAIIRGLEALEVEGPEEVEYLYSRTRRMPDPGADWVKRILENKGVWRGLLEHFGLLRGPGRLPGESGRRAGGGEGRVDVGHSGHAGGGERAEVASWEGVSRSGDRAEVASWGGVSRPTTRAPTERG